MFDVFYSGKKPGQFVHEREADSIEHAQSLSRTRYFWWISYLCDYSTFDWNFEPVPWQSEFTHVWPTPWKEFYGTYLVPRAGDIKHHYHTEIVPARLHPENYRVLVDCDFDTTWLPHPWEPPYIYVFGNQWHRAEVMPTVEYHAPGASERKYMSWPRAALNPCIDHWEIPADITGVDTSWRPDPGDPPYIYQFATQHQKTGGPRYVVPGATEVKYLAELKIRTVSKATAIYEIDHLDGTAGQIANTTRRVRYFDNYRDTLIRIAKSVADEHEYVWICSSICDYTNFDFSWHPEDWQATMLHVFASSGEKFGDTFFMHAPTFTEYAERKALLEWYDLNFVDISVPRRPMPVIKHDHDSHVDAVRNTDWLGPLAVFTMDSGTPAPPAVSVWREKTRTVVPLSPGATTVVVPKSAVPYIKTQLYDYPYIDKTQRSTHHDQPLDIVFVSNGEVTADRHFQHLLHTVGNDCRVKRVDGINGRVAAYQAAAQASTTPWFFSVYAKLEVSSEFDWSWQPDRMQAAKHYIFHALNPVNGLEYGHMAVIAHNKKLLMLNTGQGLDFTLDQAHEVVPVLSGVANYIEDPWMAWRTAFRECLKLRHGLPEVENQYRLEQWLTVNLLDQAGQWSCLGAQDAMEYYNQVNGDFDQLHKSYGWAWLQDYFISRYKNFQ
jgi:hypothetical protein